MSTRVEQSGLGLMTTARGEQVQLWGAQDFHRWWYAIEERFFTPVGRKLLYAVSDAEEHMIRQHAEFANRWYLRRSSVANNLAQRRNIMGWGHFDVRAGVLVQPVHDLVDAGSALAHKEHLESTRFNMEWQQHNEGSMSLSFSPKTEPMTAVGAPPQRRWSSSRHRPPNDEAVEIEFTTRRVGFFVNDERHFLLPDVFFSYLFEALLSVELHTSTGPPGLCIKMESETEEPLFAAVSRASYEAMTSSNRLVFFDTVEDLRGVFRFHVHRLGLGAVIVSDYQRPNEMTLDFIGEHTPLVVGWVYGLICLGSGERVEGEVSQNADGCRLQIWPEKVSFSTS